MTKRKKTPLEDRVPVYHGGDRCSGCSEWLWCNGDPLPPHTQLQCLVVLNSRLTAGLESFERKLANKASELDFKVSRVQRRLPWWCKLGLALAFLFAASGMRLAVEDATGHVRAAIAHVNLLTDRLDLP